MKLFSLLSFFVLSALLLSSCVNWIVQRPVYQKTYQDFRGEQKSFTSRQGKIKYMDQGQRHGEPILLLHGVPTSGWLYRNISENLAERGYRVITPDMLGFGSSDNPSGYDIYSEKYHASRLLALMNHLGIKRWHHVCHDAGGLWTQALAEKAPERLKSLTLLNSVLLEDGFKPPIRMDVGLKAKIAMKGYRSSVTNTLMTGVLFRQGLEDCRHLTDQDKEGIRRPLLEGKTNSLYYFFSQTCNQLPDYRHAFKALAKNNCRTQVIWGTSDDMLLWEPQADEVKSLLNIRDSDVHLLQSNHFLQEEQPVKLSRLIDSFVASQQVK